MTLDPMIELAILSLEEHKPTWEFPTWARERLHLLSCPWCGKRGKHDCLGDVEDALVFGRARLPVRVIYCSNRTAKYKACLKRVELDSYGPPPGWISTTDADPISSETSIFICPPCLHNAARYGLTPAELRQGQGDRRGTRASPKSSGDK